MPWNQHSSQLPSASGDHASSQARCKCIRELCLCAASVSLPIAPKYWTDCNRCDQHDALQPGIVHGDSAQHQQARTVQLGCSAPAHLDEPAILNMQIGAGLKSNSNNIQAMCDAGGFRRITQLLQWTAFTFPPVPSPSSHGSAATPSSRAHSHPQRGEASSPKGGLKPLSPRHQHAQSAHGMSLPDHTCYPRNSDSFTP